MSFFEDMDALGVLKPDVVTRITEYMDGRVQKFIERLEELGVAYGSAGSVYFDIAAFEKLGYKYRKLVPAMCATAKEMEEGEGALAAEDAEKRSPNDFALWKASKPGEPAWESKWGPGRPGWHIECSVATDINGDYLDIHAGGEDLKFPHHDNEMAQIIDSYRDVLESAPTDVVRSFFEKVGPVKAFELFRRWAEMAPVPVAAGGEVLAELHV